MSPEQEEREERITAWCEERSLDRDDPFVRWLYNAEGDDEAGLPPIRSAPAPHPGDPF